MPGTYRSRITAMLIHGLCFGKGRAGYPISVTHRAGSASDSTRGRSPVWM